MLSVSLNTMLAGGFCGLGSSFNFSMYCTHLYSDRFAFQTLESPFGCPDIQNPWRNVHDVYSVAWLISA
eukprot:3927188-Amphidinium_carterae.1